MADSQSRFNVVVAVVAAVLGLLDTAQLINGRAVSQRLEEAERVQGQILAELGEARAERESLQEYELKVLAKIEDAIDEDDPDERDRRLRLVIALLQNMDKHAVAAAWLGELQGETEDEELQVKVEQARAAQAFRADEVRVAAEFAALPVANEGWWPPEPTVAKVTVSPPAASPAWSKFHYDVFLCEDAPQRRDDAQRIVDTLTDRGASTRLRKLSTAMNGRSGYRATGTQIRPESGERATAEKMLADTGLGASFAFETKLSSTPTKGYLSIFVCGERGPGGDAPADRATAD